VSDEKLFARRRKTVLTPNQPLAKFRASFDARKSEKACGPFPATFHGGGKEKLIAGHQLSESENRFTAEAPQGAEFARRVELLKPFRRKIVGARRAGG
jgi:hypothetical protein